MFDLQDNYLNEDDPWTGIITATDNDVQNLYHTTLNSMTVQLFIGYKMIYVNPISITKLKGKHRCILYWVYEI